MKHTYYAPVPVKRVEWKENLKAIGLAISMGLGAAVLLFFQLSK